jgi:uncharacterized protein YbjT (DUF2867 family)
MVVRLLLVLVVAKVATGFNVAVAGATGRVGQLVVQELLSAGHSVTALTRSADKAKDTLPDEIQSSMVDFATADADAVADACGGADRLIWCASGFAGESGESIDKLGMQMLPKVFASESLPESATPRIIFLSSAGVTRPDWDADKAERLVGASDIPIIRLNPGGILGKKAEAEQMLRESGVNYCVVRPTGLKFEDWPQGRPVLSQGDVAVGRTNPTDLAQTLISMLDQPAATGKTFEFFTLAGYPAPLSLSSALEQLQADADGPLDESAVDATFAVLQQLLPGEQQDATKLEMGRTYEQVDQGVVTPRERGAAPTAREQALASNALSSGTQGKRQRLRSFVGRLLSK